MTEPLTLFNAVPTQTHQADVAFFDPPMCCPTGLCGPALNQTLPPGAQLPVVLVNG